MFQFFQERKRERERDHLLSLTNTDNYKALKNLEGKATPGTDSVPSVLLFSIFRSKQKMFNLHGKAVGYFLYLKPLIDQMS